MNDNINDGIFNCGKDGAECGIRDLNALRKDLEEIDEKLLKLFEERMELSREVGLYKKSHGLQIFDAKKEAQKVQAAKDSLPQPFKELGARFQKMLMELGREVQNSVADQCD